MFRTASRAFAAATSRLIRPVSLRNGLEALAALALFSCLTGLIHWLISPIQFSMSLPGATVNPDQFLRVALIAIAIPALAEEFIFRGLLQPTNFESSRDWAVSLASLALFVLWHPVQVWVGLPTGQAVFLDPGFLVLAAALGAICTLLTHRSASLWPAVIVHWVIVVVWKASTG